MTTSSVQERFLADKAAPLCSLNAAGAFNQLRFVVHYVLDMHTMKP